MGYTAEDKQPKRTLPYRRVSPPARRSGQLKTGNRSTPCLTEVPAHQQKETTLNYENEVTLSLSKQDKYRLCHILLFSFEAITVVQRTAPKASLSSTRGHTSHGHRPAGETDHAATTHMQPALPVTVCRHTHLSANFAQLSQ